MKNKIETFAIITGAVIISILGAVFIYNLIVNNINFM